jgi:hypothetical protein
MSSISLDLFGSLAVSAVLAAITHAQIEVKTLHGSAPGDRFGWAISPVGDVDNDGIEDFAVGAPLSDANGTDSGEVRVYSGRSQQLIRTWVGSGSNDFFGWSIAKAGDLDADGFDDVLIGAPETYDWYSVWTPVQGPGYAQLISGQTGAVILHVAGPGPDSALGISVAAGGDVDGDGVADLLLGAPGWSGQGLLLVVSGASGATVRQHTGGVSTGYSCAFLGDINNDGRPEYAVGEPVATYSLGSVRLYDAASGTQVWHKQGFQNGEQLGWTLARVGDLNGDGKPELLAHGHADGCWPSWNCSANRVVVFDGPSGTIVRTHNVSAPSGFAVALGNSLADLGDVDGDGVSDYAAGAPQAEFGSFSSVKATLAWSGATGTEIASMLPTVYDIGFGISIGRVDGNGDGLSDLLIGDPLDDVAGTDAGRVHVFTFVRSPVTYCEAKANSLGCTPFIQGVGVPSATIAQPFRIKAFEVINNKNGLLFYGFIPQSMPFQGGALCTKPPLTRCTVMSSTGNPPPNDCSGSFVFDFNERIRSGADPLLVAGTEVFAQYWSRDPGDPFTTSLTDALAFYINP